MPLKRDAIEAALNKKGFEKLKKKDHDRYNLVIDGRITQIGTKISTGSGYKTIGDNLLIQMYKQLKMNNLAEFKKYIICQYSYNDYIASLRDRNQL